ncbi:MAG: tetratricopeptide repeat protein [Pirellulales bacterium]|nr:tetratricopeptide repeat protein [Pirellulales bacterium]
MNPQNTDKWLHDATDDNFEHLAIEASKERPVIVDFWASWCQPCRMLTPALTEAVGKYDGEIELVKVNTEVAPKTAAQFDISSIPTVFAIINGQIIDSFQGLLDVDAIEQWLNDILLNRDYLAAKAKEEENPQEAISVYRELLERQPDADMLKIDLARCLQASGDNEAAQELLTELEKRGYLEPEAKVVKSRLTLASSAGDLKDLRQAFETRPDDLQAALTYANALAANGDYETAFELHLDIIVTDRQGIGEEARLAMVNALNAIEDDALISTYRRKLAAVLY